MKFHIEIEASPAELRQLMGLPDLEGLQQRMLEDIQARIEQGVEGYDPLNLMQPYFKTSLAGMELMQRLFTAGLAGGAGAGTATNTEEGEAAKAGR
jgi:hypothetical protein